MLPVLLDLKFLKIYTYGVFLVLAFFWSTFLLWKNIRLTSYKENEIFDSLFISIGAGLFISRLVHVLSHLEDFGFDILKFVLINGYPGLSLIGFIGGSVLGLYIFTMAKKIRFLDTVDYFITPAILALGIGKIGSFFSGAEIGAKTKFPIAVKYAGYDGFRHLTAFYEATLFFIGAYLSYKLLFEVRRQKYIKGFVFYFFIWYFSIVYFFFEPLKNSNVKLFSNHSINGTVSLAFLLTFSFYFLYYFRGNIQTKIERIKNSILHYGQKAFGSIHQRTRRKTTGGEGEAPSAS